MKLEKNLLTLILFTTLISVSGCGKKGASPRNLSVTTSFAMSSAFSGGIHFSGKNDKGEWFSVNATNDDSVSVVLGDGEWDFAAVGWAGDLTGKTSCAVQRVQLNQTTTDINLSLSEANCSHPTFSGSFAGKNFADSTNGFFPLNIYTCGSFVNGGSLINSLINSQTNFFTLNQACNNNPNVPFDMKRQARAIEVAIPGNITPGINTPHIVSSCIPLNYSATSDVATTPLRIPTNHIPVMIKLFEDKDCKEHAIPFEFPAGLASNIGAEGHHARLHKSDSPNKVVVIAPFTISRYGQSLFYKPGINLLPEVKCGADFCLPSFSVSDTAPDFVGSFQRGSNRVDLSSIGINSCPGVDLEGTSYTIKGTPSNGCDTSPNGKIIAHLEFDNADTCSDSTNCSETFSIGNTSHDVNVRQVNPAATEAYEVLYRILGGLSGDQPAFLKNSLDVFRYSHDDEESPYGIIRYTREMLAPDGPLGLFWEGSCDSMSSTKTIKFEEEDEEMEVQVILTASNALVPENLKKEISIENFENKLIFKEKTGAGNFVTKQIMHFSCDKRIGMAEGFWDDKEDEDKIRHEKELVFWNTQDPENALVEVYRYETQNQLTSSGALGDLLSERTSYDYLIKLNNNDKYRVISQQYEWRVDNSLPGGLPQTREHLSRSDISTGTASGAARIVHNKLSYHLEKPSDSTIGLFTDIKPKHMGFDQSNLLLGVPSNVSQFYKDNPNNNFDYTEAGNQKAYVYLKNDKNIYYRYFNGSSWGSEILVAAAPASYSHYGPRIIMDNSGKGVIAYMTYSSTSAPNHLVKTQRFSGNSPVGSAEQPFSSNSFFVDDSINLETYGTNKFFLAAAYQSGDNSFIKYTTYNGSVWTEGTAPAITASNFSPQSVKTLKTNDNKILIAGVRLEDSDYLIESILFTPGTGPGTQTTESMGSISPEKVSFFRNGSNHYLEYKRMGGGDNSDIYKINLNTAPTSYTKQNYSLSFNSSFSQRECINPAKIEEDGQPCNHDTETPPLAPIKSLSDMGIGNTCANCVMSTKSLNEMAPSKFKNLFKQGGL